MIKLTALYKKPSDIEAFEKHYWDVHVPLNSKTPGLLKSDFTRFTGSPMGEPAYYLQCDMYYENIESFKAAMKTPEARAAGADLMSFAKDNVVLLIGEILEGK